ncbi:adhesin, putative [Babesia caballi]|uniref:Adhesin, putative n=1 Tax=Babesia caballi TaxID=5871 RepID=A0AAV4LUU0_BABCB|nr:adhesin, putative [Babesia caballi]
MRVRPRAERRRRPTLLARPLRGAASPNEAEAEAHVRSGAVDVEEVMYCVLDSLVDGKADTQSAATSTVLRFARLQQDFTIRSILYFMEVQRTTESHQHALLLLLRKCITQSHETIPTGLMRDVLLFMLKELSFLNASDVRQSVIVDTVNETAVLCPAFSVEVILVFIRDMRQESSCMTETLCIYIRLLAHVFSQASNNDYIRSVDVVGQILSLYDPSTISVEAGELCRNLVSLLCTLSKALHPLQEWRGSGTPPRAATVTGLCEAMGLEDVARSRFSAWHKKYIRYRPSVGRPEKVQSETMGIQQLGSLIEGSPPPEADVLWSARSADLGPPPSGNRPVARSVRLGSHKRVLSFAAALYGSGTLEHMSERSTVGLEPGARLSNNGSSTSVARASDRDASVSSHEMASSFQSPESDSRSTSVLSQSGVVRAGSMLTLGIMMKPSSPHGLPNAIEEPCDPSDDAQLPLQTLSGPMGIPTVGVPAGFQEVLEPLFTLMMDKSLASIYTNPCFNSACLEVLFALSLLSKHVSHAVLAKYGMRLLDSVIVRFHHYLPNTPYKSVAAQGHSSVWMTLHRESSDTYRNKIVTIFSSIGAYGDKMSMLPPPALVMCLLHLCRVLMRRHAHSLVCQMANLCEVLFSLLLGLHACGKASLLASCDSSFVPYYADEEDLMLRRSVTDLFLDVSSASACKDFVRTLVAACRFLVSDVTTRCFFLDFLFRKALRGSEKDVNVALFMLGWACSHPSICESLRRAQGLDGPTKELAVHGALFWRVIDTLHTLLGRMQVATANPFTLRLLLSLINHLSRGDWMLLHCLVGYRSAPNYGADFYSEGATMRITRHVHQLLDFVFSLKVVYDLEKRIAENTNCGSRVNPKLTSLFFRKMYCGQHAASYDLALLVCGSRSFERFLLPHNGDAMFMYLLQLLLTNSKMSVFTALRSLCHLFTWGSVASLALRCSEAVFARALAFVLVYLHDPVNYFGEAFAAAKVLPYVTEMVLGERLELAAGVWMKSAYRGVDAYMLAFESGETYGHLSGRDHIVLHFEKMAALMGRMAALESFGKTGAVVVNQLTRICQGLKPPPATYTSLLKLGNLQSSSTLTLYHGLGIMHVTAAYARCSAELCCAAADFLLGFRGHSPTTGWDPRLVVDEALSPVASTLGKWAGLTLAVSEQLRYTMGQLCVLKSLSADDGVDQSLQDARVYYTSQPDNYIMHETHVLRGLIISTLGAHQPHYRPTLWKVYYALRTRLPSTAVLFTKFSTSSFAEDMKAVAIAALGYLYAKAPADCVDDCLLAAASGAPEDLAIQVARQLDLLGTAAEEHRLTEMYGCCFHEGYEAAVSADLGGDVGVLRCVVAPLLYLTFQEADASVQLALARAYMCAMRSARSAEDVNLGCRFPLVALKRLLYFISSPALREFGGNQLLDTSAIEKQFSSVFYGVRWDLNFPDMRSFDAIPMKPAADGVACSNVSLAFFAVASLFSEGLLAQDGVLSALHVVLSFGDFWHGYDQSTKGKLGSGGASARFIDVDALVVRFMRNCVTHSGWQRLSQVLSVALFMSEGFPADLLDYRVSMVVELLSGVNLFCFGLRMNRGINVTCQLQRCMSHEDSARHAQNQPQGTIPRDDSIVEATTARDAPDSQSQEVASQVELGKVGEGIVRDPVTVDAGSGDNVQSGKSYGASQPTVDDMEHTGFVDCMLLLWAHMLRLDPGSKLRASLRCCLETLLRMGGAGPFARGLPAAAADADVTANGGDHASDAVERIDLLVPKESLMLALLCCMKYLSASSCVSGPFAVILQLILQQRYSDLDHEHLESILATIFINFSNTFERQDVPCSLHSFVVDLAQTDFDVLCNVIFAPNCIYSQRFKLSVAALITRDVGLLLQLLGFLERCVLSEHNRVPAEKHSVSIDFILDFVESIYLDNDAAIRRSDEGVSFVTTLAVHFTCMAKSDSRQNVNVMKRILSIADGLVDFGALPAAEAVSPTVSAAAAFLGSSAGTWIPTSVPAVPRARDVASDVRRRCLAVLHSSGCHLRQFMVFVEQVVHSRDSFKPTLLRTCISLLCNLLRNGALSRYGTSVLLVIQKISAVKDLQRYYYRVVHYYLQHVELVPVNIYTSRFTDCGVLGHLDQYNDHAGDDVCDPPTDVHDASSRQASPGSSVDAQSLRRSVLERLVASMLDDISTPLSDEVLYVIERAAASLLRFVAERRGGVRQSRRLVATLLRNYRLLIRSRPRILYAYSQLYLSLANWLEKCSSRGLIIPVEVQRHLLPPLGLSILHRSLSMRSRGAFRHLTRALTKLLADDFHPPRSALSSDRGWLKAVLLRSPGSPHLAPPLPQLCLCGCNNPKLRHASGKRFCVCHAFYLLDLFSSCFPSHCWTMDLGVTESIDSEIARLRHDEHMQRTSQVLFGLGSDLTPSNSLMLGSLTTMSHVPVVFEGHDFVDLSSTYHVRITHTRSEVSSIIAGSSSPALMLSARSMRTASLGNGAASAGEIADVLGGAAAVERAMTDDARFPVGGGDATPASVRLTQSQGNGLDIMAELVMSREANGASDGVRENDEAFTRTGAGYPGVSSSPSLDIETLHSDSSEGRVYVDRSPTASDVIGSLSSQALYVHEGDTAMALNAARSFDSDKPGRCSEGSVSGYNVPLGIQQGSLDYTAQQTAAASSPVRRPAAVLPGLGAVNRFTGGTRSPLSHPCLLGDAADGYQAPAAQPTLKHAACVERRLHWHSARQRYMGHALNKLPCLTSLLPIIIIADFQFETHWHMKRINVFTSDRATSTRPAESWSVERGVSFFDISNLESVWNTTLYTSPMVYRHMLLIKYLTRPRLYASLFGERFGRPKGQSEKSGQDGAAESVIPEDVVINAVRGAAAILHMALLHLSEEEDLLHQHIVHHWPHCFVEMARYNAVLHFQALARTTTKQLCKMLETASGRLKSVLLESMELFSVVRSASHPGEGSDRGRISCTYGEMSHINVYSAIDSGNSIKMESNVTGIVGRDTTGQRYILERVKIM